MRIDLAHFIEDLLDYQGRHTTDPPEPETEPEPEPEPWPDDPLPGDPEYERALDELDQSYDAQYSVAVQ